MYSVWNRISTVQEKIVAQQITEKVFKTESALQNKTEQKKDLNACFRNRSTSKQKAMVKSTLYQHFHAQIR